MISLSQLSQGPIDPATAATPPGAQPDYSKVSWGSAVSHVQTPQTAPQSSSMIGDVGKDIQDIPGAFNDAVQNFGNSFAQAGTDIHKTLTSNSTPGKVDSTGTMLSKAADVAGSMTGAVNKGIGDLVHPAIQGIANVLSDAPGVQQVAGGKAGDTASAFTQNLSQKLNAVSQAHPEIAKKVSDALNVIGASLALTGSPEDIADGVTGTIDSAKGALAGVKPSVSVAGQDATEAFGNSKLDQTYYHGTSKANAAGIKANGFQIPVDEGMAPRDVYVTSDPKYAEQMSGVHNGDGEVVPVKVNAQNVKEFDGYDSYLKEAGNDPEAYNKQFDAVVIHNATPAGGDHVMVGDPQNVGVASGGKQGLIDKVKQALTPAAKAEATPTVGNSESVAADAIKNPLTKAEQETAVGQGRAQVKGANGKIEYAPDKQTISMQKALKPLADDGKIVSPKTPEDHINNVTNTQQAITDQGTQIRSALQNSKATWNANELKGNLDDVNVPDPVKNDKVFSKNATSLKGAAVKIAQDATKTPDGILDVRQNLDNYIKENYGKNFFVKGRDADPWHMYVYNLRDAANDMAAYKLPEGKLPDGTTYGDALKNQSNLINAKEAMQEKFAREYPEGSTKLSRFMKDHPNIKRFGLRTVMTVGSTIAGVSILNSAIKKLESNVGN